LQQPQTSVGIFVFCGDTEEKAAQVQAVMDFRLLSIEKGKVDEAPSHAVARAYNYSRDEWARVLHNRKRMITGTPDVVREKLMQLAHAFETDEIVVATFADTQEDRLRSYELLAQTFGTIPHPHTSSLEGGEGGCSLPLLAPTQ
jgi:alkanesulfonate monooxygenase SsuD/methylene tetrahydromethanopterin reductase-like flavin-dependent oxidoreductase (luciferase family)